jgi:hypothetical protein
LTPAHVDTRSIRVSLWHRHPIDFSKELPDMTDPNQPPVTPPPVNQPPVNQPPIYQAPAAPAYQSPAYQGQSPAAPAYGAPAAYGQQSYGQPVAAEKYNVLAIVSLISAFFVSLVAIITGHIALSQIKKTGEKGRGLALAGTILGYVGFVAGIIVVIAYIALIAAGISDGTISTNS